MSPKDHHLDTDGVIGKPTADPVADETHQNWIPLQSVAQPVHPPSAAGDDAEPGLPGVTVYLDPNIGDGPPVADRLAVTTGDDSATAELEVELTDLKLTQFQIGGPAVAESVGDIQTGPIDGGDPAAAAWELEPVVIASYSTGGTFDIDDDEPVALVDLAPTAPGADSDGAAASIGAAEQISVGASQVESVELVEDAAPRGSVLDDLLGDV